MSHENTKSVQSLGGCGFTPDPTGDLTALPWPLLAGGDISRGRSASDFEVPPFDAFVPRNWAPPLTYCWTGVPHTVAAPPVESTTTSVRAPPLSCSSSSGSRGLSSRPVGVSVALPHDVTQRPMPATDCVQWSYRLQCTVVWRNRSDRAKRSVPSYRDVSTHNSTMITNSN